MNYKHKEEMNGQSHRVFFYKNTSVMYLMERKYINMLKFTKSLSNSGQYLRRFLIYLVNMEILCIPLCFGSINSSPVEIFLAHSSVLCVLDVAKGSNSLKSCFHSVAAGL